ncbi:DUF4402 domain-containing protein [Lujinxingia vulgaris]|uniref:DUF4402 domain-containing protein n=1 Tax=Lujinxingia vulgaris TaxID=2600176 RepID=A0A5C6XEH7_9DELT|nr:DUF4402 domain-containing protein [Lujinxingia vulgaris]TXD42701.1 DUF4402 domain-containing protein [Lujinxingia vulgaris]
MTIRHIFTRRTLGMTTAAALLLISPAAFADNVGSMDASVTLQAPLSVAVDTQLSFGTLAIPVANSATLVMTANGETVDDAGVGDGAIYRNDAVFGQITITGEADTSVSISTPASLELASGVNITSFNLSNASPTLALGTATVKVGGTLVVDSTAQVGSPSQSFDITVEYQ